MQRIMPDIESRIMSAFISESASSLEEILSPDDYKMYLRLKFLNNLHLQHYPQLSERELRSIYMREFSISDTTYAKDKSMMFRIFGPQLKPDLEYLKGVELQMAIRDRSLARAAGDMKAVVQFSKYIMELMGLDKPITAKGEGEGAPQQIITNIQINHNGTTAFEKTIDLTLLDKLSPMELNQIADLLDAPLFGVEEMQQHLEERNGTDAD